MLDVFKEEIDREIEEYLDKVIKETKKKDKLMTDAVKYVKKLALSGGKRLRPAFMYYGYLAAGGKEEEKIIKASVSVELVHLFLLIHDDIIDRDERRHGMDTVHYRYSQIGRKLFARKDHEHFGNSMALIIGDMVNALGNKIIFNSGFKPENIMKALTRLQQIISYTVIGQSQDIFIEYRGKATEREVLQMYENKTAKYTIEGPMHLGASLAGASEEFLEKLSHYALPIGIAFQIQDDILGIFGSEKKLGKKVGSDIEEGKQTILVVKALHRGNFRQRKLLHSLLGKRDLLKEEAQMFQSIITETGSLEYAKKLSNELMLKGKRFVEKIKMRKEAKEFFIEVANYMAEREL